MKRSNVWTALMSGVVISMLTVTSAKALDYDLGLLFSGSEPSGSRPWLTLDVVDLASGGVEITLSASGLTGNEFVDKWYLNLDPNLAPVGLSFTTKSTSGTFASPTISKSPNAYKADGDGYYDIVIDFASRNADRFGAGESITFVVTHSAVELTDAHFDYLSRPDGGAGPFHTAAHVGAISGGLSAWIAEGNGTVVPVPDGAATAMLLGLAFIGLEGIRRKFRR